MALTIALPLSGLELDQFLGLGARLLSEQNLRAIYGAPSPSAGSESSGVSSFTPSMDLAISDHTPSSSRSHTPALENLREPENTKEPENTSPALRVIYKDRDILNLGANIREPTWQMRTPNMPPYNHNALMTNKSIYYRLGEHGLTEDYPTRCCKDCGFTQPSPSLF